MQPSALSTSSSGKGAENNVLEKRVPVARKKVRYGLFFVKKVFSVGTDLYTSLIFARDRKQGLGSPGEENNRFLIVS